MRFEHYDVMDVEDGRHVKLWTRGVPVEDGARKQLANTAKMPFIFKHVAAMPDVHVGIGATVGSVVATKGAIIPAAVGVDIGCGMMAVQTSLTASDLPESLVSLRTRIERAVPHGFVSSRGRARKGEWENTPGIRNDPLDGPGGSLDEDPGRVSAPEAEGSPEAVGNLGWRQPLHRDLSGYRTDGLGDVAFRFARHRQPDRADVH